MKKTFIFFIIFISIAKNLFSQESTVNTTNQFILNLIVPAIEFEVSTGKKSTIDLKLGTGFGYAKSGDESDFGFFPEFGFQYRYYYNLEKRAENGKKISENSGNYLTGVTTIRSGNPLIGDLELNENYGIFIGPAWGLQRTYNSGIKLNLNLGAGYGFNDRNDSYFSPFIGIQLGWVIAK